MGPYKSPPCGLKSLNNITESDVMKNKEAGKIRHLKGF